MSGTTMLHEKVTPRTLGMVRAWVFAIWVVKLVPDPLLFLARLPPSSLTRYGVLRLVPERALPVILTTRFLVGFKIVLIATCLLAMVGARPWRVVAPVAAVLLTFHQGLVRGFTIMNHQELALLLCAYILAVVPAGDGFSVRRRRRAGAASSTTTPNPTCSAALVAMTAVLLVAYAAVGAHRLATSGPGIFFGDGLAYWLGLLSGLDPDGWGLGVRILRHPGLLLVAKAGFAVITVLELLAPLCLVHRRFRRAWLAVLVPFHVVTWLTMDIFFWEDLLLMAVLLTDVDAVVTRSVALLGGWRPSARRRPLGLEPGTGPAGSGS